MYLSFDQFNYIRISLLIWRFYGFSDISNFDTHTGNGLSKLIEEIDKNKLLIIDFKKIIAIAGHSIEKAIKLIDRHKIKCIFLNINNIANKIERIFKDHEIDFIKKSNNILINLTDFNLENLDIKKKITGKVVNIINNSFKIFPNGKKRLPSTPLLSYGAYDASAIIRDTSSFLWTSVLLAEITSDLIKEKKITKKIKLISGSLRGTQFATSIGILLKIDIEPIDHFGPRMKIFETYYKYKRNDLNNEYIYIGDFVIGGTEIKIAQNYIYHIGSQLNNAVVLGSLFPNEVFKEYFDLRYIVELEKSEKKMDLKIKENWT